MRWPFTTLKISPSFGFSLTDCLSEKCTRYRSLAAPRRALGEIKIQSMLKFYWSGPIGLCVKYHITEFIASN